MNGNLQPIETRAIFNLNRTNANNNDRIRRSRLILIFGFIFFALVRIWIFIAEYNNTALTVVFLLFNIILLLCMYKYLHNSTPDRIPVAQQTEEDLLWQLITLQILRDHLVAREMEDQRRNEMNTGYDVDGINQLPTVCYPSTVPNDYDVEANLPVDDSESKKVSLKYISLDSMEHDVQTDTHCCICLENYIANEVLVVLPCKHLYHKICCTQWLSNHRTCPLCNQLVNITLPYVTNPVVEQSDLPLASPITHTDTTAQASETINRDEMDV